VLIATLVQLKSRYKLPVMADVMFLEQEMSTDKEIEEGLELIKKRRRNLYLAFLVVFALAFLLEVIKAPGFIGFFVVAAGVLVLFPMLRWLSLSTCPKCHGNYFGIIARINKTKCSSCGLELNYKAPMKNEINKT